MFFFHFSPICRQDVQIITKPWISVMCRAKFLNYQNARIVIENVSVSFIQFLMFVLLPHRQQNVCHLVFEIRIRVLLRDIQQITRNSTLILKIKLGQHCEIRLKTAQSSKSTFIRDLNLKSNNALFESLAHLN